MTTFANFTASTAAIIAEFGEYDSTAEERAIEVRRASEDAFLAYSAERDRIDDDLRELQRLVESGAATDDEEYAYYDLRRDSWTLYPQDFMPAGMEYDHDHVARVFG